MKRYTHILTVLIFAAISGCAPGVVNWDIRMQAPVPAQNLNYTDEFINISFTVDDKSLSFDLKNKTENGLKINFDELAFISPGETSLRVVTSSIRFTDRFAPQAPVVIPPGMNISETIIPAQNIFFRAGDYTYYGWDVMPLFPQDPKSYVGKEFGLYFPMEIKGKKVEHIFKFKVTNVEKKK